MSVPEMTILTNMCMIYDHNGNVLVQERRKTDWQGLTFPGGHVEPGESFVRAVIREVKEETGLEIQSPVLCGVKQFQTPDDVRYIVFLYKTDRFSGQLCSSEEGAVFWLPQAEFDRHTWVPDFDDMLRVFTSEAVQEIQYFREEDGLKRLFF